MAATGFPGINRGKRKLRKIAINKVTMYHADFFNRYF
jgi:hypothetical protein